MVQLLGQPTKSKSAFELLAGTGYFDGVPEPSQAVKDMMDGETLFYENTPPGHRTVVNIMEGGITDARIEAPGYRAVWRIGPTAE